MKGFNRHDIARDACQLFGAQAQQGYDWWWHSFTGYDALTGVAKPFFIEFFLCNPASGGEGPVLGVEKDYRGLGRSFPGGGGIRLPGDRHADRLARGAEKHFGPDGHGRNLRKVGVIQLFDLHGKLVDRIHAENIGCEYGEYDKC